MKVRDQRAGARFSLPESHSLLPSVQVLLFLPDPKRVLALNCWNAKEDAERYHREQYHKINEMLSHLLDTAPVIRTFDVHTSTTHRVAAGKAA